MTEEEYFRKHYTDVCYNDKPLSPYWDFFQDGVEFGERQSEKKIEELEKENKVLRIHQTNAVLNGLEMKVLKDSHRDRANKAQDQLTKAIKLLKFWVNDFHDGFNRSNKYEERHKALVETEQLLREIAIDNDIQASKEGLNPLIIDYPQQVKEDLKESNSDVFCKDCPEEECTARKLGFIC